MASNGVSFDGSAEKKEYGFATASYWQSGGMPRRRPIVRSVLAVL
jgi:hypothetical protein